MHALAAQGSEQKRKACINFTRMNLFSKWYCNGIGQFQRYGHYKSHKIEDLRRSYHTLKNVLSEHIYIYYKAFILNDV